MRLVAFISLLFLLSACGNKKPITTNPPGYDLNKPSVVKLPLELDEISGLTFYRKDRSVFAITDDDGFLYKITPGAQTTINKWQFAPSDDYEEVVLLDSTFYILRSDGHIKTIRFRGEVVEVLAETDFGYPEKNEFESMYYDSTQQKLVLVCKDCDKDKKATLSTYTFDPVTRQYSDSSYVVDIQGLAQQMGVDKFKFKPAAANLNPLTGEVFIISSINKLLLVTDLRGKVKGYYMLDHGLFKQPEGLCFTENGKLIISNETADIGTANLLIYERQP